MEREGESQEVSVLGIGNRTAGRDFKETVVNVYAQRQWPESREQAKFGKDTGIWCGRAMRRALERLLLRHGFTVPELRAAWKAKSLKWDSERAVLKAVVPLAELVAGWGMIATMLLFLLLDGFPRLVSSPDLFGVVVFAASVALYGGTAAWVYRRAVIPASVAWRVRRVLASGA